MLHRPIWTDAGSIVETEGIFQIPVVIEVCGEQQPYVIVVPSRIHCLDAKGKLSPKNVGRYHIFKSTVVDDYTIYVSEQLKMRLCTSAALKFKGVE